MRSHHDVLGIRPNAGHEEIELAYKGRRSQYHPDRYAQSDQETQAWATACMQEVNAAYKALINGRTSAAAEAAASRQPASQPGASAPMTLGQALRTHPISKTAMSRIYVAPNIPLKKLHNALESYGHGLKPSDVLVLLDDTIFSSGKDGLLVTERELRVKEAFNPPETFALDGIALGIRGGDLYVNNRRVRDFNITERDEVKDFVMALNEALKQRSSASQPQQPTPAQAPSGGQQGYQLEAAFLMLLEQFEEQRRQADPGTRGGRRLITMLHLMGVMLALTDQLQVASETVRGAPATDRESAWFRSDVVRLELILFQAAWISHTLEHRYGRTEQQIENDMALIMMYVVSAAVAAEAGDVEVHDDEDFERLMTSPPMRAAKHRMQHDYNQMGGGLSQQADCLFEGLCQPVAFEVDGPSPEHRALWAQMTRSTTGFRCTERWLQEAHHILLQGLDEAFGQAR